MAPKKVASRASKQPAEKAVAEAAPNKKRKSEQASDAEPKKRKAAAKADPPKAAAATAKAPAKKAAAKKAEVSQPKAAATKKAPKKATTEAAAAQKVTKAPAKAASKKRAAGAAKEPAAKKVKQPEGARRQEPTKEQLPPIPSILAEAGRIFVCGMGDSGQLGLGEPRFDDSPDDIDEVPIPIFSPLPDLAPASVKQIAAGGMHSVALTTDGEVFTTGVNDEAALGRKTKETTIWENQAGGEEGETWSWGRVEVPIHFGKVEKVTAGDSHTVVLTALGAIYAWGLFRGASGPLGFLPGVDYALLPTLIYEPQSFDEQIVQISSGADHVLALTRGRKVWSWGYGRQGQLGRIPTREMRHETSVALKFSQILPKNCVGWDETFQPASIATGSYSSFIISTDGRVLSCGVNNYGQLGHAVEGQTVESNSIPWLRHVHTLDERTVRAISGGKAHTLVLDTAGQLISFGQQTYGRLGRADISMSSDEPAGPGPVDNLAGVSVVGMAAGPEVSSMLSEQGQVYMTGMASNKQLGVDTEDDVQTPFALDLSQCVADPPITRVSQVAFGGQHTMLLVH